MHTPDSCSLKQKIEDTLARAPALDDWGECIAAPLPVSWPSQPPSSRTPATWSPLTPHHEVWPLARGCRTSAESKYQSHHFRAGRCLDRKERPKKWRTQCQNLWE